MVNRSKEFLSLIHTYKNLVTDTQSARLVEVLDSDLLHANKNYVAKPSFGLNTLFQEVQLMKWENTLSSKWLELGKIPACTVAMTEDEFITTFIKTMTDYLESTWEKDLPTAILALIDHHTLEKNISKVVLNLKSALSILDHQKRSSQ